MKKTLYDISWQVSEPEYRADLALSYSTLARFEREGFDNLDKLFAKVETPSLLLGSLVDTMITGGKEEFDHLYFVADFPALGEKETTITKFLYKQWCSNFYEFSIIPNAEILEAANMVEFQRNWRDDTRVKVLKERCSTYYKLLFAAEGKTVVDQATFNSACAMVRALHNSPATSGYFADNVPDAPVQRYYQLKFKHSFEGVDYRCMADLLCVDYEGKRVIPIDLKTSSHTEWNFQDSFNTWRYDVQSRLYWNIIRANMDNDDYFKDFTLDNYRFIVVNKRTLIPLVWEFPYTKYRGVLVDENGNKYRHPFEIGKELQYYLHERPQVPNGVNINKSNTITCLTPYISKPEKSGKPVYDIANSDAD